MREAVLIKGLRELAKKQTCKINSPVCGSNPDNEQTVLAHLNGAGLAIKHGDLLGAHSCYSCHAFVDGTISKANFDGEVRSVTREDRDRYLNDGIIKTIIWYYDNGVLEKEHKKKKKTAKK